MKVILIIGECGSGKTWVMKQLIKALEINTSVYTYSAGLYRFVKKDGVVITGVYNGDKFEGSDKLSMAVMTSNKQFQDAVKDARVVVCEGDRFTNSTFIKEFSPYIIRIEDDGAEGRKLRGSNQTERHLKSIKTRVQSIPADILVGNSEECLKLVFGLVNNTD